MVLVGHNVETATTGTYSVRAKDSGLYDERTLAGVSGYLT